MRKKLTLVQRNVYSYILIFFRSEDQLPTQAAITEKFKYKSANSAYEALKVLERKGWLKRNVLGNYMFTRN